VQSASDSPTRTQGDEESISTTRARTTQTSVRSRKTQVDSSGAESADQQVLEHLITAQREQYSRSSVIQSTSPTFSTTVTPRATSVGCFPCRPAASPHRSKQHPMRVQKPSRVNSTKRNCRSAFQAAGALVVRLRACGTAAGMRRQSAPSPEASIARTGDSLGG
jgi:hypothetical protein